MCALRFAKIFAVFVGATQLAGCGGGSLMPPGSHSQLPVSAFNWPNSANGAIVLDATGNQFYFGATSGVMYQANTNVQLSNLTISPKAAQAGVYPVTGVESYCSPGLCAEVQSLFDVMLTNNPSGSNCIAVLVIHGFPENFPPTFLTPDFFMGMTINTNPYGFAGQTTTVTAYKTYWAGNLPICGGSSPYAGTYTSTDTSSASFASGWTTSNGTCVAQSSSTSRNTGPPYVTFTIDSGGVLDSETSKIVGSIVTPITNSVLASPYVGSLHDATCAPVVSITSATQNASNKWVFTGTETFAGVSTVFSATQN